MLSEGGGLGFDPDLFANAWPLPDHPTETSGKGLQYAREGLHALRKKPR
jgi:hypothetical protein